MLKALTVAWIWISQLGLRGVGPLLDFFRLTSAFFGLTSDYKLSLLEEVYLCVRHLGMSYSDVLMMPTYERRFFLTTFINEKEKQKEHMEEQKNNVSSGGKGTRTTKISGEALKSRLKSGEIPNQ